MRGWRRCGGSPGPGARRSTRNPTGSRRRSSTPEEPTAPGDEWGGEKEGSDVRKRSKGVLVIVGGHEAKDGDRERSILGEVAALDNSRSGPVLIVTLASQDPKEMAGEYTRVFKKLGMRKIEVLDLRVREDAHDEAIVKQVSRASLVFFTGGDQLRITSQLGDSPVYRAMCRLYEDGGTIVGTSAGAAAMPETMLISGPGDESGRISAIGMAPGLGLLPGVVVDSHFAERGRFGRLLGAVAQNPKNLGLGLDENTAIVVVDGGGSFRVVGSGGVYVVDGAGVTYSSLSEENPEGVMSIFDVRLHVLGEGDRFDLKRREPLAPKEADQLAA
jgi:cyanophycinase